MTILTYHSTLIDDLVSWKEAADTTSSQILLSRDIAHADSDPTSIISQPPGETTSVVTILENSSIHVMTLGNAARSSLFEHTTTWSESNNIHPTKEEDYRLRIFTPPATSPFEFGSPGMSSSSSLPQIEGQKGQSTLASSNSQGVPPPAVPNSSSPEDEFPKKVGKGKEVDRGRTLDRKPRQPNPLSRAHSRRRLDDIPIELDIKAIQKRLSRSSTFHKDSSSPSAVLDDNLLEPCPEIPVCNLTEALSDDEDTTGKEDASSSTASIRSVNPNFFCALDIPESQNTGLLRTLTTNFDNCRPIQAAPTFTSEILQGYLPHVSHKEYLALKSSCSKWSKRTSPAEQSFKPSIAPQLPAEIVHQIYMNLGPFDFNSARHTCRAWYIHSLEKALLETMLRRGGWSSALRDNLTANHIIEAGIRSNDEWLLSKRIARECALGPNWLGNGLSPTPYVDSKNSTPIDDTNDESINSPFFLAAITEFGEIGTQASGKSSESGLIFTVSVCGKYLMVADGCLIYVYQLNKSKRKSVKITSNHGSLRPITSVICPRRVLACSMDTSSERHAIAVLLDSRMGLVCDLTNMNAKSPSHPSTAAFSSHSTTGPSHVVDLSNVHQGITINSPATHANGRFAQTPFIISTVDAHNTASNTTTPEELWSDVVAHPVAVDSQHSGSSTKPELHGFSRRNTNSSKSMPLETGPRSIYRNLCSSDDAPRSVAICPQRRCVAFGCSAGIELHWIDALTGQDLNRWFPLTAPSDYLYFLPPRRGVDSAKKLRLISSAARPGEAPALADRFRSSSNVGGWWDNFPYPPRNHTGCDVTGTGIGIRNMGAGTRGDCTDHYRAVPLSDGYHILFTDPATGLLCLGSDAPIGGPTKLLRKIWFLGPKNLGSPVAYTGGSDLRNGVRVVAAYGPPHEQKIWLFSVPSDVFTDTRTERAIPYLSRDLGSDARVAPTLSGEWIHWWKDQGLQDWPQNTKGPTPGMILSRSSWPVEVRGQEIGKASYVVDLAVDSGPEMTIWAFGRSGIAQVWKLDSGRNEKISKRVVLRDGTVMKEDSEGDLEISDMAESPDSLDLLTPPRVGPATFDGNRSSQDLSSVRMDRWSVQYDSVQYDATKYDADGDVLMADLQGPPVLIEGNSEDGIEEIVSYARDESGVVFESSRWHGRTFIQRRGYRDTVEELTGIARIDIEIR